MAEPLYLACISPVSRLYLACISPVSRLYLACISPVSPPYLAYRCARWPTATATSCTPRRRDIGEIWGDMGRYGEIWGDMG